jgi:hypothetical protein
MKSIKVRSLSGIHHPERPFSDFILPSQYLKETSSWNEIVTDRVLPEERKSNNFD